MDDKIQAIKLWLEDAFPGREIEYGYVDRYLLHEFTIHAVITANTTETPYLLYVSEEVFKDQEIDIFIQAAKSAQILEIFRASNEPCYVYLSTGGAKEVDENFSRKGRVLN